VPHAHFESLVICNFILSSGVLLPPDAVDILDNFLHYSEIMYGSR